MNTIKFLMMLALLAVSLGARHASAQPLEFNGTLEDGDTTLEDGEFVDEYEIEIRQGQLVELNMVSEDVDAYLVVLLPDGEQYENDDAGPEDYNASLVFIAPQTGTYTIMATSALAEEAGAYQITGKQSAIQPLEKQKGTLAQGDQVNWKGGEYCDLYEIELAANETRVIELSSDAFDTFLVAHGADGQVQINDDAVDVSSSMLVIKGGPEGTTFTLVATSYAAAETGPYRLTSWTVVE